MTRAPCSITTSERVNTEAGLSPVAANTRWIGRSTVAPLATWMTAPSRISAVLSATTPSRSDGTTLPRCVGDQRIARRQRLRHRADGRAQATDRSGRTVPARTRRRRTRCAARPCRRRACRRPSPAPWPRHPAGRRAASPRASARADRCISTPRPAGAAGRALEAAERGLAQRHHLAVARQLRLGGGDTASAKRQLGTRSSWCGLRRS